ncbi:hypothetical protein [Paraburkholderia sp.]|uniref:hypothetical protein n=1 Tax=Paraburkholderia sp. TaxID=1926495 RepID=UPI0039E58369
MLAKTFFASVSFQSDLFMGFTSLTERWTCSRYDSRGGNVTRTWQLVAQEVGSKRAEIVRMASAFEHDDLSAAYGCDGIED